MQEGMFYFITGLHGSGKTTIGKALKKCISQDKKTIVLLDGDELRIAFGGKYGYDKQTREDLAMNYVRIARILCKQGIDVILCTISLFHNVRKWNRDNFQRYYEVYLEASHEILLERDKLKLYEKAEQGKEKYVYSVDLDYEKPQNPDMVIFNNGKESAEELARKIYHMACLEER